MRLDLLLVERGFAESRTKAQWLIESGCVKLNGTICTKPSKKVTGNDAIEVAKNLKYVSRAGYKLEGLFEEIQLELFGTVVCDIGSSTGGFVDFFLQHGVSKVYSVDVNIEQLHEKLRADPRVIQIRANAKDLVPSLFEDELDYISVDVSFISVTKLVHSLKAISSEKTNLIILIKPQFEISHGHKGVVRNKLMHFEAIRNVLSAYQSAGFRCKYLTFSKIKGVEGNIEFFAVLSKAKEKNICNEITEDDIITVVERAWEDNG